MKRKFLGFAIGLLIAAVGIFLVNTFPRHQAANQIAVWSLIVVVIVMGANQKYFKQGWFWKACIGMIGVHCALVAGFRHSLPFSSLGVAILMSVPEAIAFLIVLGRLSERADD